MLNEDRLTKHALELVEAAKNDGSWDMLDNVENLIIPSDLEKEFNKYKSAGANFENFPDSAKRGILEWIKQAKTEKTRKKELLKLRFLLMIILGPISGGNNKSKGTDHFDRFLLFPSFESL